MGRHSLQTSRTSEQQDSLTQCQQHKVFIPTCCKGLISVCAVPCTIEIVNKMSSI